MQAEIIVIILDIVMIGVFVAVMQLARNYFNRQEIQVKEEIKESSLEKILKKNFEESQILEQKQKFKEMELLRQQIETEIKQKTAVMTQKAEQTMASVEPEEEVIEQGGKIYAQFGIGLENAMPRNKEEQIKDMSDLMDAVKMLEGFDQENYYQERDKSEDMAKGMFYDKITTKLYAAMKAEKLNKEPIVVFDKLVYLGLKNIKNIGRKELVESLRYMKEAGFIKNYFEINPQLIFITQTEEKLRFTNPEKVVLVFASEEDVLTLPRLMEAAKWQEDYAKKIINGLVKKNIVDFADNVINVKGYETRDEKKRRRELEEQLDASLKEKEKKRLEEQQKIQQEFEEKKKQLEPKSEISIQEEMEQIIDKKEVQQKAKERMAAASEVAKEDVKKFKLPEVKALELPAKASTVKQVKNIEAKPVAVPKPAQEVELKVSELTDIDEASKNELLKLGIETIAPVQKAAEKKSVEAKPAEQKIETVKPVVKIPPPPKVPELPVKQPPVVAPSPEGELAEVKPKKKLIKKKQTSEIPEDEFVKIESQNITLDSGAKPGAAEGKMMADLLGAMSQLDEELTHTAADENKEETAEPAEDDFDNLIGSEFVGDNIDEALSEEAIVDGILSIYERYEHINGGLMDIRLIQQLLKELYPDVTIIEIINSIETLKSMGLVTKDFTLGSVTILLFKDIQLNEDMLALLKEISLNGYETKKEAAENLDWDEEKTLNVMKALQDIEVLRLDEKGRIVIPGLYIE